MENYHKSHRTLRPTERCEIFSEQTPTYTVHCTPTGAMRNATTFNARRQEPRAFLRVLSDIFPLLETPVEARDSPRASHSRGLYGPCARNYPTAVATADAPRD